VTTIETVSTLGETIKPLDNISNKMDDTDQMIGTVRRTSRQCAIKATLAIAQQTGKKKMSSSTSSRKCSDDKCRESGGALSMPSPPFKEEDKVTQIQKSEPLLQKESSPVVTSIEESTCYNAGSTPDEGSAPNNGSIPHAEQFFTPLVISNDNGASSTTTQMISESSDCGLEETKTPSVSHEDSTAIDEEDKYSTPPCDASTDEKSESVDGVRRLTTIIKKNPDPESQIKVDQMIVNKGCLPSVNLALLTKLTPSLKSNLDQICTPTTVIKECLAENQVEVSKTVTKGFATNNDMVTETPATITKVVSDSNNGFATVTKHNANVVSEQNYGSPELGVVISKPQDTQIGNSSAISCTTKKQITPNSAFSPAKLKVNNFYGVYSSICYLVFSSVNSSIGTIWTTTQ